MAETPNPPEREPREVAAREWYALAPIEDLDAAVAFLETIKALRED